MHSIRMLAATVERPTIEGLGGGRRGGDVVVSYGMFVATSGRPSAEATRPAASSTKTSLESASNVRVLHRVVHVR